MAKLTLNVDDLAVESFDTATTRREHGTVQGMQADADTGACSHVGSCWWGTGCATGCGTCVNTCKATCGTTCPATCEVSCPCTNGGPECDGGNISAAATCAACGGDTLPSGGGMWCDHTAGYGGGVIG